MVQLYENLNLYFGMMYSFPYNPPRLCDIRVQSSDAIIDTIWARKIRILTIFKALVYNFLSGKLSFYSIYLCVDLNFQVREYKSFILRRNSARRYNKTSHCICEEFGHTILRHGLGINTQYSWIRLSLRKVKAHNFIQ